MPRRAMGMMDGVVARCVYPKDHRRSGDPGENRLAGRRTTKGSQETRDEGLSRGIYIPAVIPVTKSLVM
jgi:hypothetical protein